VEKEAHLSGMVELICFKGAAKEESLLTPPDVANLSPELL